MGIYSLTSTKTVGKNPRARLDTAALWPVIHVLIFLAGSLAPTRGADYLVFPGAPGPGTGKQVVFLTGDEEYRSEESMPQMAKILATRHGFKCTMLFAINPSTGAIDP